MIRNPGLHCVSNAQVLMYPTEIVVGVVDRNHVAVILEFLRECICGSSKAPDAHCRLPGIFRGELEYTCFENVLN